MILSENEKMTVDLHDMQLEEAKYYLEKAIDTALPEIKEITVIHGYHKGQVLLNMVRKEFKHERVIEKVVPYNNGTTLLYLK